nr:uncharacterized transmembrane protein DDB_G0285607-like [Drosophila virilis]
MTQNCSIDKVKLIMQAGTFTNMNDAVSKFVNSCTEVTGQSNTVLYYRRGVNQNNRRGRSYNRGKNYNHNNCNCGGNNNNNNNNYNNRAGRRGQNRGRGRGNSNQDKTDWDVWIQYFTYCFNTSTPSATHEYCTYELVFGRLLNSS